MKIKDKLNYVKINISLNIPYFYHNRKLKDKFDYADY